jgi:hypothetical protein
LNQPLITEFNEVFSSDDDDESNETNIFTEEEGDFVY